MIIGNGTTGITQKIETPISSYSRNLVTLLENYLDGVNSDSISFSIPASQKAKITLRYFIFPNEKEFQRDYQKINDDIGKKTRFLISNYTKCIMQLLGRVAECLLIDRCVTDATINMICINLALLKGDIYRPYSEIDYSNYIPFSPSFKYIITCHKSGVFVKQPLIQYNPQDTSADISWVKKDNVLSQLKTNLPVIDYLENAKLQIKVSSNYNNLSLSGKYELTPIIYFDLCDDYILLKKKYQNHLIVPARAISEDLHVEMVNYFRILAAYVPGIVDHINIDDFEVSENQQLAYILRATPQHLLAKEDQTGTIDAIIEEAKRFTTPIVIGV